MLACFRPSFLFPSEHGNKAWFGYVLALASGFTQACAFICSRKSASCSAWIHLFSTMVQGWIGGFLFADNSMAIFGDLPHLTSLYVGFVTCIIFSMSYTLSLGSMWCPVAVSATVTTAVRMGSSYASQSLFFGEALDSASLGGAGLMLASVVVMAGWRSRTTPDAEPEVPDGSSRVGATPSAGEETESESLASFIAAEFVDCSHHERVVRQRRTSGAGAEIIGATMVAVATVAI